MECSLILSGQEALGEAKQLKVLTARLRFQSIMNRGIMTSQHVGEATARTGTGIRTGTGRYSNSGSCWGWVGNQPITPSLRQSVIFLSGLSRQFAGGGC